MASNKTTGTRDTKKTDSTKVVRSFYFDKKVDPEIDKWCSKQRNLTESIRRMLINTIAQYGTDDYLDALSDELLKMKGIRRRRNRRSKTAKSEPDTTNTTNTQSQTPSFDASHINLLGLDQDD